MATDTEVARFLHFVKANQEQPCPTGICKACYGTGHIPRPEAVELWTVLTKPCRHIHGEWVKIESRGPRWRGLPHREAGCLDRVARSYAEMHVAFENWLAESGFTITFALYGDLLCHRITFIVNGVDELGELFLAGKAALIACGWQGVKGG